MYFNGLQLSNNISSLLQYNT